MSIVKCHSADSKCLESTSSHLLTKYRCRSIGGKEVQCKFALAIQHRFPFSRILRERVSHFEDSLVHEGGGGGGGGRGISITANLLTNFPLVVLRETQGYFVSIYHKQALTSRFMQISLFVEQVVRRGNVASVKRDAISFRSFLNIIVWLYCGQR